MRTTTRLFSGGMGFVLSMLVFGGGGAEADTHTWTGGGANNNASTPGNWGGTAPVTGDSIVLNATTNKNMTWDAAAPSNVASWFQAGYSGTVTFATVYVSTGFTNFTITGDCVISNGTWTHAGNSGMEANRLNVRVNGGIGGRIWTIDRVVLAWGECAKGIGVE